MTCIYNEGTSLLDGYNVGIGVCVCVCQRDTHYDYVLIDTTLTLIAAVFASSHRFLLTGQCFNLMTH